MSDPGWHGAGMGRHRHHHWQESVNEFEEIAGYGGAIVVRDLRGRLHIQGGSDADRKRAHDWVRRYLQPVEPQVGHLRRL